MSSIRPQPAIIDIDASASTNDQFITDSHNAHKHMMRVRQGMDISTINYLPSIYLTRFNKFVTQATPQMAADNELSSRLVESKYIVHLWDQSLFCF